MSKEPVDPRLLSALESNLDLLDQTYLSYLQDPQSVDPSWRALFSNQKQTVAKIEAMKPHDQPLSKEGSPASSGTLLWISRVVALLGAYRTLGHLQATLDPLGQEKRASVPELDPKYYGLSDADLQIPLSDIPLHGANGYQGVLLQDVLSHLQSVYCGVVGSEFMHIADPNARLFIQSRIEQPSAFSLDPQKKIAILDRLMASESFERFVHTKYLGAKRFSLEGGESLIPLLDFVFQHAGNAGISEIILGMPHRGRLNVLTHLFGKPPSQIFSEFEDFESQSLTSMGDVKYHLGHSQDITTKEGQTLHVSLAFNPSHLEAVNPVVLGRVRAKQERNQDLAQTKVLGILLHGDAAFAGQGVVMESLNLSQLAGYKTGGTIHVVLNNQIGFTTAPSDSRSTTYCTDVAKMLQIPIFHVNGDHPEAIARVVSLAMEYRATFQKDVVIDLVCYRKYGHNETDEPSFTQPIMYQAIVKEPSVVTKYAETLTSLGVLTKSALDDMKKACQTRLEAELKTAREQAKRPVISSGQGEWSGYQGGPFALSTKDDTGVPKEILTRIANETTKIPDGFDINPKISRLLLQRRAMGMGEQLLDWGMAETLSYGSLLLEGIPVRLSGQDCRRGTFSHRQSLIVDTKTGKEHISLQHLSNDKERPVGAFTIHDSSLSEFAVLGFEYGYSLDCPQGLTLWEAQFGDFVNGAQIIIDQYISSGETKWARLSGLVLLLPHGYEGQGPEHSSARLERFLQLCGMDNIQVANPTTPAQIFHLLRRQVKSNLRKPLVVMTPKSLLRHPLATSSLDEFTSGKFHPILLDKEATPNLIKRVILCSGKIYYDLLEERSRRKETSIALLRIEQLYPFDEEAFLSALQPYQEAKEYAFVQEEPANMGAQSFLLPILSKQLPSIRKISRMAAASPATGSHKLHAVEQKELMEQALGPWSGHPRANKASASKK